MESENLTEKQLKKKEANIRYREKMKKKLEEAETVSKSASQPEDADEKPPEIEEVEETIEGGDEEEKFVLDKKAYFYLLEKAKLGESMTDKVEEKPQKEKPKEQDKKPEPTEDPNSFFFSSNRASKQRLYP